MGLDMDLTKVYHIGAEYKHNEVTGSIEIAKLGEKLNIDFKKVKNIECDCVYWRKANAIHKWFVDNVQDGKDDCKQYHVERSQLKELMNLCNQVLENPEQAAELLPSMDGFYFGGVDYDEGYFEDLKYTVGEFNKLDLDGKDLSFNYYYESSW